MRIYSTALEFIGTPSLPLPLTHPLTCLYTYLHRYSNNDVYEGSLIRGKRVGHGKLQFSNGDIYIGTFLNDFMHGDGLLVTPYSKYEGNFVENKFHGNISPSLLTHLLTYLLTYSFNNTGKGRITYSNGHEYTGSFVHSKKHGLGVYKTNQETSVESDFSIRIGYDTNLIEEKQVLT